MLGGGVNRGGGVSGSRSQAHTVPEGAVETVQVLKSVGLALAPDADVVAGHVGGAGDVDDELELGEIRGLWPVGVPGAGIPPRTRVAADLRVLLDGDELPAVVSEDQSLHAPQSCMRARRSAVTAHSRHQSAATRRGVISLTGPCPRVGWRFSHRTLFS